LGGEQLPAVQREAGGRSSGENLKKFTTIH
jgi:hypothetical protein